MDPTRPFVSGLIGAGIVGIGAYLFFGFFAFHLLFVDSTVDEANPFDAAAVTTVASTTTTTTAPPTTEAAGASSTTTTSTTTTTSQPPEPEILTLAEGSFISLAHPTSGTAQIITDGERRFLRFEDFETDNGPDLNVYLGAEAPEASPVNFVDLGDLKGNIGAQNYAIPPDVDIDQFSTVFIWCVRFSVGFGAAGLS